MHRLAALWLAASFLFGSLFVMGRPAVATPFADVPANHWAYQYIQTLAADGLIDGYPDGAFKGDRPLTRYEMATVVARALAKLQATGTGYATKADLTGLARRSELDALGARVGAAATKSDLDKLQKLVDAFKDELDALGVRVTTVEDALESLDKRTKFAQSIQFHGTLGQNTTMRQRYNPSRSIVNVTGAPVNTYYGTVAPGRSAPVDPLFTAFASTAADNNPAGAQAVGSSLRYDDRFNFVYTLNENLTVAVPLHILNTGNYGGEFGTTSKISVQPDILLKIAHAGALTNISLRSGQLDDLKSSRLGLAYRAPDPSQQNPFALPYQPYPKGVAFGGVLNGLTEFQFSFTRLDQTLINTLTDVLDPSGDVGPNLYFQPVVRPQASYVQNGPPGPGGSLVMDTFPAASGPLGSVYLRRKAVIGTVYVSAFTPPGGATTQYTNAGVPISGGAPAPPFFYLDQSNLVVFTSPLPAGSSVTIGYVGLTATENGQFQRYQANFRVNHKIAGLPGGEVGFSINRIYDDDNLQTIGDLSLYQTGVNGPLQAVGNGFGQVSNTVFGLDTQLPIPFISLGGTAKPVVFGEVAMSRFSADYRNVPTVGGAAVVFGLRLKFAEASATLQFQTVGANFVSGTPFRYFGNPPAVFQNYRGVYLPEWFGFASTVAINATYDANLNAALRAAGASAISTTALNPALTFAYPVWNPFTASGPGWYSSFAPNESGPSLSLSAPLRLGGLHFNGRLVAQHLQEREANANATSTFGPQFGTNVRATYDTLTGGASFGVPVFGQAASVNLSAGVDRVRRNDRTLQTYTPYNPAIVATDPTSLANQALAGNGVYAQYAPNYFDMYRVRLAAGATVPITRDIVFGAGYNTQQFHGAAGTTLGQNVAERKDQYDVTLTYNVPQTASSVLFSFRNNTYKDLTGTAISNFNFSQNREDVTFTIRF